MLEKILEEHIPESKERSFLLNFLYGPRLFRELCLSEDAKSLADKNEIELKGYHWKNGEDVFEDSTTRIALFQNGLAEPTNSAIEAQRDALICLGAKALETAARCSVNIFCFQEIWNMPVAFCTQKKLPWVEFAEDAYNGPTTTALKKLAKEYNMVIISPIFERDENDVLWNTAVVIDNHGQVLGISRKNHIPISGMFSEASYYNPSDIGHPVFQTEFGKVGVAICYERHHPQSWLVYALNGAQIVFNPSATVKTFSEHLWPIEARDAAIQNGYFTCAINRVGTETFIQENVGGEPAVVGPFFGSSYVTAPDGSRTPGLSTEKNGLLIADVDLKNEARDGLQTFQQTNIDFAKIGRKLPQIY